MHAVAVDPLDPVAFWVIRILLRLAEAVCNLRQGVHGIERSVAVGVGPFRNQFLRKVLVNQT